MTDISAAEIETVARAICKAHGHDPDESMSVDWPPGKPEPHWVLWKIDAITQIAAHRAIEAMRHGDRLAASAKMQAAWEADKVSKQKR